MRCPAQLRSLVQGWSMGHWLQDLRVMWGNIHDTSSLERAGIACSATAIAKLGLRPSEQQYHAEAQLDNVMHVVRLAQELTSSYACSMCSWTYSLPLRFLRLLSSDNAKVARELRELFDLAMGMSRASTSHNTSLRLLSE
eukprot:2334958-Amphidinium_carterae.1